MAQNWSKESTKLRYDKTLKFTTIFTVTMLGILAGIVTQHDNDIAIKFLQYQNRDILFVGAIFVLIIGLFFSLWKLRMLERLLSDEKIDEINSRAKRPNIGIKEYLTTLLGGLIDNREGLQPFIMLIFAAALGAALLTTGEPDFFQVGVSVLGAMTISAVFAFAALYAAYRSRN